MAGFKSASLARDFGTLFRVGTLSGLGDGRLLERFVAGRDEVAFEELMARHGPTVLGICRKSLDDPRDIEDAFQATFMILVRKAGSLRDRDALSSWLYGVALRVARRARANAARRSVREVPLSSDPVEIGPKPLDWIGDDIRPIVDEEIRRLPEKQQIALILCLLEGYTHESAASRLGWPLGTVKSRIASARQTLIRRLARRGLAPSSLTAIFPSSLDRVLPSSISPRLARLTLDAARESLSKPWIAAVGTSAMGLVQQVARIMLVDRLRSAALIALAIVPLAWTAPALLDARPVEHVAQAPSEPEASPRAPAPPPKVDRYGDPLPDGAVMRLGTIRYRQTQSIEHIVYSPDGQSIVTDNYRQLQFWDTRDGRKLRDIDLELDHVNDLAVSPDGKTITVAGFRYEPERKLNIHRLKFIDLASGLFVRGGEWTERGDIIKIGYSPDGKTLAVLSDDGILRLWDAATAVLLKQESLGVGRVTDIAFSRDPANPVMAIGSDHDISIGAIGPSRKIRKIATQNRYFGSTDVALSPDGTTLAGTMPDSHGEIQLWRASDGTLLNRFKLGKNALIYRMTFSPDGKILAANGNGNLFEAFDIATGKEPESLSGIGLASGPLAFAPDGKTLAYAGDRQTLHLWDMATGKDRLATPDAHQGGIGALEFFPDGKTLISGSDDRTVRVWDLATGRLTKTFPHDGWVRSLSVSADGSLLATASEYPGTVSLWSLKTGERLQNWEAKKGEPNSHYVRGVAMRTDGSAVIAALGDGTLRSWDVSTWKERPIAQPKVEKPPPGGMDGLTRVVFSPDVRTAALISQIFRVQVVDVASGEVRIKDRAAHGFAFAPDGRSLAVGRRGPAKEIPLADGRTRFDGSIATCTIAWLDTQTGRALREIEIPEYAITSLAFSPDGKLIASGAISKSKARGILRIFRLRDLREIQSMEVPCYLIQSLAFTPDGKKIAAGLEDTSIVIWDVRQPVD